MEFPVLRTERLLLNRPLLSDREQLLKLLNESSVFSENTLNIPYPYTDSDADFFIDQICGKDFENGDAFVFAIRLQHDPELIGAIGLHLVKQHKKAEAGYWLGIGFYGAGIMSEALQAVIRFGFEMLELNKIYANYFPHNPASGRILEKCGMQPEGFLKQEFRKGNKFHDVHRAAILRADYHNFS